MRPISALITAVCVMMKPKEVALARLALGEF